MPISPLFALTSIPTKPTLISHTALASASSGGNSTTTTSITSMSGQANGDLLLAIGGFNGTNNATTVSSGWTEVLTSKDSVSTSGMSCGIYYKYATGTDTFQLTNATSSPWGVAMFCIRNGKIGNYFNGAIGKVTSYDSGTASTTFDMRACTFPPGTGGMVVATLMDRHGGTTGTAPASLSGFTVLDSVIPTSGQIVAVNTWMQDNVTGTSTDFTGIVLNQSATGYYSVQIAILPFSYNYPAQQTVYSSTAGNTTQVTSVAGSASEAIVDTPSAPLSGQTKYVFLSCNVTSGHSVTVTWTGSGYTLLASTTSGTSQAMFLIARTCTGSDTGLSFNYTTTGATDQTTWTQSAFVMSGGSTGSVSSWYTTSSGRNYIVDPTPSASNPSSFLVFVGWNGSTSSVTYDYSFVSNIADVVGGTYDPANTVTSLGGAGTFAYHCIFLIPMDVGIADGAHVINFAGTSNNNLISFVHERV